MAGTKEGAQKARETNKQKYGKDFYAKIAAKSWKNPDRSRLTGFALLPKEDRQAFGKKGGLKTKKDYKKFNNEEAPEAFKFQGAIAPETHKDGSGVSE